MMLQASGNLCRVVRDFEKQSLSSNNLLAWINPPHVGLLKHMMELIYHADTNYASPVKEAQLCCVMSTDLQY